MADPRRHPSSEEIRRTARRVLSRRIGGAAMVAVLLAGLSLLGATGLDPACCEENGLARVSGAVADVAEEPKLGGRQHAQSNGSRLMFRVSGSSHWYVFDSDWPRFDRVRGAIRRDSRATIEVGNCREAAEAVHCEALGISTEARGLLVRPEDVRAAKADRQRVLFGVAALFGAVAVGLAMLSLFIRRRAPADG